MEEGEAQRKGEEEIWCSQRNAFGPPFVPKALDPENH